MVMEMIQSLFSYRVYGGAASMEVEIGNPCPAPPEPASLTSSLDYPIGSVLIKISAV
jgi:hypothetical protein